MDLRGARALVTGGAGLVGSHIADLLVAEGVSEIVVLDDFVRGRRENLAGVMRLTNVNVIQGDIRSVETVRAAMRGIDVVFHQAAIRITHCAQDPRLALEVLADGTFNVLEAAVGAKVQKVVAASSASVYGLADAFPTPETQHPYHNRTIYGAAKVFNEGLLRCFNEMYGLAGVALRYFNVYGPRMDMHGAYTEVLIRWMDRIIAGEPPLIFGDGAQTMDFIYITDIARANILAARSTLTDDVFNIASETETSLTELAHCLLEVMHSNLQPEYREARAVNNVTRRLADTHLARTKLGFTAKVNLSEGLRQLVEWWHEQKLTEAPRA